MAYVRVREKVYIYIYVSKMPDIGFVALASLTCPGQQYHSQGHRSPLSMKETSNRKNWGVLEHCDIEK